MTNTRTTRRSVGFAAALAAASLTAFTIASPALAESSDSTTDEVVETPIATLDETIPPADAPENSNDPGDAVDAAIAESTTAPGGGAESAASLALPSNATAVPLVAELTASEAANGIPFALSGFAPDSELSLTGGSASGTTVTWQFSVARTDSNGEATGTLRAVGTALVPSGYWAQFSDGVSTAYGQFQVLSDHPAFAVTPNTTIHRSESGPGGIPVELSGFHPNTQIIAFVHIGVDGEPMRATLENAVTDAEGNLSTSVDYDRSGSMSPEWWWPGDYTISFAEFPYDVSDMRSARLALTVIDDVHDVPTASPAPAEESGSHGSGHGSHHSGKGSSTQANASGTLATTGGEAAPGILIASIAGALGLAGAIVVAVARRRRRSDA